MAQFSWLVFSLTATFLLGIAMALYKLPSYKNQNRYATTTWMMAVSFMLSVLFFYPSFYPFSAGLIKVAFLWGASFCCLVLLQMYALKHVDTNALFPTTTTSSLALTVLVGFLLFHEAISSLQALGILMVIAVVYLYLYKGKKFQYSKSIILLGMGIILISMFNKLIQKFAADHYDIQTFQIYQYLGATLFSAGILMYTCKDRKEFFSKPTLLTGGTIGLIGFFGGYALLYALTKGPFVLITSIHSLYVLVTALTAYFFLKEPLTKKIFFLIILSIAAVVLMRVG